jgi:protein O-mannosyl-transferase
MNKIRENIFPVNNRRVYVCLALIVLTLIIYWQVMNFEFVNYDDNVFVTQNIHVSSGLKLENIKWAFTSMYASNWMPLTWLSFMLDSQISKMNPTFFHLSNVLFHIFNSILLFIILERMTGAFWRSTLVAILFAIHPLHVESVAWITERKDVLSTFFLLLTVWSYVYYIQRSNYKRYAIVFILFALGLMSKPMLVTLPFILLLLDYWPLKRYTLFNRPESSKSEKEENVFQMKIFAHLVYEKIPLFFLSIISIIITIIAQKQEIAIRQIIPFYIRLENACVSYCSYMIKMVWPASLAALYPHPEYIALGQIFAAAILLIGISSAAIYYKKRFPYLIFGWLWYLGTLVPVIGLVQVGVQSMADRYTYISIIGLFIIIVWTVADLTKKLVYRQYILTLLSAVIVFSLMLVTYSQIKYWKNSETLFTRTLDVTENNYVMECNMGVLLAGQGNIQDAVLHYEAALKINPKDADTNYNYGNLLAAQGKMENAVKLYNASIKEKPKFAPAYNNLGIIFSREGRQEKAIEQFREATRLNPDYAEAKDNLENAINQQAKAKELQSDKNNVDGNIAVNTLKGRMQMGMSLLKKGDLDAAIKQFSEVLKHDPNNLNAHISIGLALGYKQNFEEAISHFRKAIEINPKIVEAYNSLAVALTYTGKIEEAIIQLEKAIKINPKFAKAHNTLGVILAKTGKVEDAIYHLQRAVQIDPDNHEAKKNLDIVLNMKVKN